MKKTTKGALAAGSAAVLLMGGAGTLAYWSDSVTTDGTEIESGHLSLDLQECDGWTIDGGAAYDDQLLVPGDSLSQSCTYVLDIAGEHLKSVDFDVTVPSDVTGAQALIDEIDVTPVVRLNGNLQGDGTGVAVSDNDVVSVDITVTWPYGVEDNDSNVVGGLSAALDALTVSVTQNHSS